MNIGKEHLTDTKFNAIWKEIENELHKLQKEMKCSGLVIYNNVYRICTSVTTKYVEELYWRLGDFIYERLRERRTIIYNAENWIAQYNIQYVKYDKYITSINELADYLNQYISTKSLHHFAYLLWERCILQSTIKYKKCTLGEYLVTHKDDAQVSIAIRSFKSILIDPAYPSLYYTEKYEKYALNSIKIKYDNLVKTNIYSCVLQYTEIVRKHILEERESRQARLCKESWDKLDLMLEDILVVQKRKYLRDELYKILSQHKLPQEVLNIIRNSNVNRPNVRQNTSAGVNKPYGDSFTIDEEYRKCSITTQCNKTIEKKATHNLNPDCNKIESFSNSIKTYPKLWDYDTTYYFEDGNKVVNNTSITDTQHNTDDFSVVHTPYAANDYDKNYTCVDTSCNNNASCAIKQTVPTKNTTRDNLIEHRMKQDVISHGFIHPVKDFHVLYDCEYKKPYVYCNEILQKLQKCATNLQCTNYGHELLNGVLSKYLENELNTHRHLLNRRIESLYVFYCMYKHVVTIGFNNSTSSNKEFDTKIKKVYNALNPSLCTRLIEFVSCMVLNNIDIIDDLLKMNCNDLCCITKQTEIDFYQENDVGTIFAKEVCNKKDDDIVQNAYRETTKSDKLTKHSDEDIMMKHRVYNASSSINKLHVADSEIEVHNDTKIHNYSNTRERDDSILDTKCYRMKNISLPDLSIQNKPCSYITGALLRVYSRLYALVDDKTEYLQMYLRDLSRRILLKNTSYEKEKEIFEITKKECKSTELTKKGEVMLKDLQKMKSRKSGIHFLSQSIWPIDATRINIIIPDLFTQIFTDINQSKKNKHILISYEYSTVEIQLDNNEHKLNFLQYLVVNMYNTHNLITKKLITKETGLHGHTLDCTVKSLLRSNMITGIDKFAINANCNVYDVVDYYSNDRNNNDHEINKEVFYQSKISRILKINKELAYNDIANELIKECPPHVDICAQDFEEGMKSCIEKGVIEVRDNLYVYIP